MKTIEYKLVIKTNKYAGNFEREMCAYSTGSIGECEVGEELADRFKEELGEELADTFVDNIIDKADDHGWYRPVCITRFPGDSEYNSLKIFFREKLEDEHLNIIVSRVKKYCSEHDIEFIDFKLFKLTTKEEEVIGV